MDPDLNKYDLHHRVSHHPKMCDAELDQAYKEAWNAYYTPEHIRTMMRRRGADPEWAGRSRSRARSCVQAHVRAEGVHPLEGGALRLK